MMLLFKKLIDRLTEVEMTEVEMIKLPSGRKVTREEFEEIKRLEGEEMRPCDFCGREVKSKDIRSNFGAGECMNYYCPECWEKDDEVLAAMRGWRAEVETARANEWRTDAPNVELAGDCPDCGGRLYVRDAGVGWTWFCADCPHTKEMSTWE